LTAALFLALFHHYVGIPRISFIRLLLVISAGLPPFRSSHFVNSPINTVCSTSTFLTQTVTGFKAPAILSTQSFPRICLKSEGHGLINRPGGHLDRMATPSMSEMVTRQDFTSTVEMYRIRFLFFRLAGVSFSLRFLLQFTAASS
jgi:hypothetical protein